MRTGHTILLGGIGGDSHSVGLTLLRDALTQNGYRVRYLGTQNRLEDFFAGAPLCDAVMLSSMDGHTRYYLREFPELLRSHPAGSALWYLGGNLTIGDALGHERLFREMGFDRVFVKFADLRQVLEVLRADLHEREPVAALEGPPARAEPDATAAPAVHDAVMEPDDFECRRGEVLQLWKTGRGARSLDDNARFLAGRPSYARLQAQVNAGERGPLVQPRCGVPLLEDQLRLFEAFTSTGVPVLSYQVDSLTRNGDYAGAQEAIRESRASRVHTLNGLPLINCGVGALRRAAARVGVPLQVRHSARDPRLLAEIGYAGGATSFEGGAICYNVPYYKRYPLAESIRAWQYADRLTGLYHER
ncbi:MAG TPA: hypothetical protein VFZ20_19105, partial [Longimicrobium sp.]